MNYERWVMNMELYDLIKFFTRHALWLLIAVALGAIVGWAAFGRGVTTGHGHILVSLKAAEFVSENAAPEVQYDGYYVIEDERRLGTLMAEQLRSAGLQESLGGELIIGRVERVSATDYRVAFTSTKTDEEVSALLEDALNEHLLKLHERLEEPLLGQAAVVLVDRSAPVSPIKGSLAGGLAGLILSGFLLALRAYYVFPNKQQEA